MSDNEVALETTYFPGYAWTVYVRLMGYTFLLLILILAAWQFKPVIGIVLLIFTVLNCVLRIMAIRSFRFYYDNDGIWRYSGAFPWSKGRSGVKWRDLDEAVFYRSMLSWACSSYTICIKHRFTKSSEIILEHVKQGADVVGEINRIHRELVQIGKLN